MWFCIQEFQIQRQRETYGKEEADWGPSESTCEFGQQSPVTVVLFTLPFP